MGLQRPSRGPGRQCHGRCWTWARVAARSCPGCRPGQPGPSRPRHGRPTCRWPDGALLPLGIPVHPERGSRATTWTRTGLTSGGRLPFRDGSLDLICNRHESFLAVEVSRVLAPGGTFVTQQVDYHDNDDLAQMLGIEMPEEPDSWIGLAERQVTEAGLDDRRSCQGR